MSLCANQIYQLATSIHQEISSPPNIAVGFISGWITNSGGLLGALNNQLDTCFYLSGDAPCIAGNFGQEEGAIASLMYQKNYFKVAATNMLISNGPMWTQLSEGDSKITRTSVVEVSREFQKLYDKANDGLKIAVANWTLNHSMPQVIDSASLYSFPSP